MLSQTTNGTCRVLTAGVREHCAYLRLVPWRNSPFSIPTPIPYPLSFVRINSDLQAMLESGEIAQGESAIGLFVTRAKAELRVSLVALDASEIPLIQQGLERN